MNCAAEEKSGSGVEGRAKNLFAPPSLKFW